MAAAKYNITLEQGAEFRKTITWKDSAGSALNLEGYTARMKIRQKVDGTVVAAIESDVATNNQGVSGGDIINITEGSGKIELFISSLTTAAIDGPSAGTPELDWGYYDLELVPPKDLVKSGLDSVTGLEFATAADTITATGGGSTIYGGYTAADVMYIRNASNTGNNMKTTVNSVSTNVLTVDGNLVDASDDDTAVVFLPDNAKVVRILRGKVTLSEEITE